MELLIPLIVNTVQIYLSVLTFMLFLRVIYPILFAGEESLGFSFVFTSTEPVMMPIRNALDKSELFSSLPLDLSCPLAFLLVLIIRMVLMFF